MACHVPLLVVLILSMFVLALVPAILIWIIVFLAMEQSMVILTTASNSSVANLSASLQYKLIARTLQSLNLHLDEATSAAFTHLTLIQVVGLDQLYLGPSSSGSVTAKMMTDVGYSTFATLKEHQHLSFITARALRSSPALYPLGQRMVWLAHQAMGMDLETGNRTRTLYSLWGEQLPNETFYAKTYYADQATGLEKIRMLEVITPPQISDLRFRSLWTTDLQINTYSGQVDVQLRTMSLPALNNTWTDIVVGLNVRTISEELQASVADSPLDRAFVFFRQPHGHLLGASHGKYFSHSDFDNRVFIPVKLQPDITSYQLYNCLNSTDAIIFDACQQLYYGAGQDWTAITPGTDLMLVNGTLYWVAVGETSHGLNATVVTLKHRATVMAPIEARAEEAQQQVQRKRVWTYVVLGVTTALATLCPLLLWWMLHNRLRSMVYNVQSKELNLHWMGSL